MREQLENKTDFLCMRDKTVYGGENDVNVRRSERAFQCRGGKKVMNVSVFMQLLLSISDR